MIVYRVGVAEYPYGEMMAPEDMEEVSCASFVEAYQKGRALMAKHKTGAFYLIVDVDGEEAEFGYHEHDFEKFMEQVQYDLNHSLRESLSRSACKALTEQAKIESR